MKVGTGEKDFLPQSSFKIDCNHKQKFSKQGFKTPVRTL